MGRPIAVSDAAIAVVAMRRVLEDVDPDTTIAAVAESVIDAASKVRFQPSTRQLVLTFDLAMGPDGTE